MFHSIDLKIIPYTLILSLLFSLFSCSSKQQINTENSTLDSLSQQCHALLLKLQTDSLRTAAEVYMKATPQYSKSFFKARQYYINADFNARNYEKVLTLLKETEQMPHFSDFPEIACDYMYTRARVFQYSSRYEEAIEAFKECLAFTPNEKIDKKILPSILSAMTQLMNTYIFSGNVEKGYHYFKEMKQHPTPVIKQLALRDLYTHLAYLAFQSGHTEEAFQIADSVFILPLHDSTPEKLFRDYSYASVVFYNKPDAKERVIKWLEQALEEANKYDYNSGIEWSMNNLASLYWQQNRVEEGLLLMYKALAMAKKRKDQGAECYIYTELSLLYKRWELYPQAQEFADQAIAAILPTDNLQQKSTAFKTKADVFKAMEQPDSSLYYYQKAEEYAIKAQIPIASRTARGYMAELLIQYYSGDSLNLGTQSVRDILKEMTPNGERSYYFYCLGKGLIKQGHIDEGEAMLDSMYAEVTLMKGVTYSDGVLEFVIDHYLSKGNSAKVMQYTTLYRQQIEVRYDKKISAKVASSMIQYQTEKKEQQLKLATTELSVKNLRIKLYIVALILLLLLLLGGMLWYWHERKLQKSRQLLAEQDKLMAQREREMAEILLREQEKQLASALENLRDANLQSEQMREQLSDFLSDQNNLQSIASITPSILREKGEVKFRRHFVQLFPNFILTLRSSIPDITRGEEILCMLIALHQNMDEVADILCIEKKSVKMSRYRLRKKIGIEQEESLDDYIKSLI